MTYSIQNSGKAKYKVKRSEFLSFTVPINDQKELSDYIKRLKGEHQTARHFCWAYRIYDKDEIIENYSDAGEPSGSAGIPILNALRSKNIINCGVIVIRYFGGVKLGKRGLIDAYNNSSAMAIADSDIEAWVPILNIKIITDILYYGNIIDLVKKSNGKIISDISANKTELIIQLQEKMYANFKNKFYELTKKTGKIKMQSEHDQTKEVRK